MVNCTMMICKDVLNSFGVPVTRLYAGCDANQSCYNSCHCIDTEQNNIPIQINRLTELVCLQLLNLRTVCNTPSMMSFFINMIL